jgi:hypothetical protein
MLAVSLLWAAQHEWATLQTAMLEPVCTALYPTFLPLSHSQLQIILFRNLFLDALKSKLFSFFRIKKKQESHPHKIYSVALLTAKDEKQF